MTRACIAWRVAADCCQATVSALWCDQLMKLRHLLHSARAALRTEKGRQIAERATDTAADTARRASPRHSSKIAKAQQSLRKYLHRP